MYPPATGQWKAPPVYCAGGLVEPCDDPTEGAGRDDPRDDVRATALGFGVAMPFPCAPGIVSVWPTTRFGSASGCGSTLAAEWTSYFVASASSVSEPPTVTTTPLTGGITRIWRTWSSFLDERWFAHQTVIIVTPKCRATPVRVSPDFTR